MFTGLIEEIGKITAIKVPTSGVGLKLTVHAPILSPNLKIDDSIAINGVCQTVVSLSNNSSFTVDTIPVTLEKSTLGKLQVGDQVHLESSLTLSRPIGGHFVLGHVNGLGKIEMIKTQGEGALFQISSAPNILSYLVDEGSISLDGVSLTLSKSNSTGNTFEVSLIPHTLRRTLLGKKKVGDFLNIEVDILAKYVHKLFNHQTIERAATKFNNNSENLTMDKLRELGF